MVDDVLRSLRARVARAPTDPGVYRWLDADGGILYIGKAKNLRNRLKSYVTGTTDRGPWIQSLLRQIRDVDFTVTGTELEALLLETNLIKEHRPRYNVLMKDDKNYVYAKVTVRDTYPRIDVVRRIEDDGAQYIGPITSAWEIRETLTDLRTLFPYRNCRMTIEQATTPANATNGTTETAGIALDVVCTNTDRPTPCLDHHIGQCAAPCIGALSPAEYRARIIDPILRFLRGDSSAVVALLRDKMATAVAERRFEKAAELRDRIATIERLQEKQIVSDPSGEHADIIGVAVLSQRVQIVLFQRRDGRLTGEQTFSLQGQTEDAQEALAEFLPQYYSVAADVPPVVVIGHRLDDHAVMEAWLAQRAGRRVELRVPERGLKSRLLELAERNAQEKARQQEAKWESESRNADDALRQLQDALDLPDLPHRIEGYDISHLGGTETVGSMVVALHGKAAPAQYRSFTITTLRDGDVDDYRSLQEVLTRRLRHLAGGRRREEEQWKERGVTFGKAKKSDAEALALLLTEQSDLSVADAISPKDFLVARSEDGIAGCCRLLRLAEGPVLLQSVCVLPAFREQRLAQTLVRKILASVKKGNVYVTIAPALEQEYAALGFRHVLKTPPSIDAFLRNAGASPSIMVMVYNTAKHKPDRSLETRPDLLLIDGGKGQLSVAVAVLHSLNLAIPVAALAKREEELFVPGAETPVLLPKDAPARFLLQRLRDEAHRFANKHRMTRGTKRMMTTALDGLPGIGPAARKALLQRFGSVDGIRAASDDALREVVSEAQWKILRTRL